MTKKNQRCKAWTEYNRQCRVTAAFGSELCTLHGKLKYVTVVA